MGKRKRNPGEAAADGADSVGQKRARQRADSRAFVTSQSVSHGKVDATYGQRSAIPGLDDPAGPAGGLEGGGDGGGGGESDVDYAVDVEALRYLRSVREEASGIPTLLVAPRAARARDSGGQDAHGNGDGEGEDVDYGIYENGVGDSRGWYEDGAYTAAPASPPSSGSGGSNDEHSGERDAQEVYYEALLTRFEALRQQLAQVPPVDAVERLDTDHGSYMSHSAKDYKMWRWRLGHTEPKPAQLARMDKDTILRLLRIAGDRKGEFLGAKSLVGDKWEGEAGRRVSAWIWGLLARLPARGELGSEEVGVVRELGKRAVWVGVEMKGMDMGGLEDQMGDGEEEGEEVHGDDDDEIVDVEVHGEEEHLDSDSDSESCPEGDEMRPRHRHKASSTAESRNSPSHPHTPIIGPISPESLRKFPTKHTKPLSKEDDLSEVPTPIAAQDEEEALSQARARILARLGPPATQPTPINDQVPTLIEEIDKVLSLPSTTTTQQQARERSTAMQKHLAKLTSALKQHKGHPLWPKLETQAAVLTHLILRAGDDGGGGGGGHVAKTYDALLLGGSGDVADPAPASPAGPAAAAAAAARSGAGERAEGPPAQDVQHGEDGGLGGGGSGDDARQAARVLLDMVITVAGEVYGQRDLLEFREAWGRG